MSTIQEKIILKDLGAGLILRRSTPEDADALADFNAHVHSDDGPDKPDERLAAWTRDLLMRPHPTFSPDDFTIVEETATGRIVSSLNLIPQTWTYEGIPFDVGRSELVGTLPEFRKRGLVRIQYEEIHRWCAERGLVVQAITGIPYFYRKFGYEMALDLSGERFGYEAHVPKLKDGETEPYRLRPAAVADLPFIAEVYEQTQKRYPIVCQRTPEIWRYELDGRSEKHVNRMEHRIIEDESGKPVGYLLHPCFLIMDGLFAFGYELKANVSWLAVTSGVVRYMWETGKAYAERDEKPCTSFGFILGAQHPVYEALGTSLPSRNRAYAWYLRVPDLPGFIRHIAPVLEKRLSKSIAAGHTGKIRINQYSHILVLQFERGKLTGVEEETRKASDYADLGFPELTILQMIFGRSSFADLHAVFPDVYYDKEEAVILFDILFPKKHSNVLGVV
ncbi:MAG: GNAT family N-acetyltransferase [Anaerolineales bacterium]|nr:GNAT family N-acetyltransferase [Anaerolineales bacterium]